jgi:predicted GIY-YIG superfamily endonuclease
MKIAAGRCRLTTKPLPQRTAEHRRSKLKGFLACQAKTLMLWYFLRFERRAIWPQNEK